ncbi:hypothetical protein AMTR_s00039p00079820 [Amborella trichopoda]|uniref:Uncharacterized protein n=1 Tax=Amborella trichopoda TaxID=13333 RepID=U5CRB9_AMBTC|nr:hypothetical protein AMTR_s00039p00079820 [Amborella trichopoda]
MCARKESRASRDVPPFPTARRAASLSSAAFLFISAPSSDPISFLTAFSTLSALTTSSLSCYSFTATPTPSTPVTNCAFTGWSECIGHATIGTPMEMLSMHEFHPQCVMNPPVEG